MNIVTVILSLALAFIMFALGLGLTGSDFLRVIKQPRDFFVGAFSQIISAVTSGRGMMPSFKDQLTTEEIEAVAYYIFNKNQ